MNQNLVPAALVLTALLVAGCLGGTSPPREASAVAPVPAATSPPAANPSKVENPVRALSIEATFTTPGTLGLDNLACAPWNPNHCEGYGTEILTLRGGLQGTLVDDFHFHGLPNGSYAFEATYAFTGAIPGCGSGSLTWRVVGGPASPPAEANPNGRLLRMTGALTLVPGSTTTGLRGIVAANLTEEFVLSPITFGGEGKMKGTIVCRDVPVDLDHKGTRAVALAGRMTADGVNSDQVECDPGNRRCEYYAHMFLDLTGTMTGRITDIFHFAGETNVSLDSGGVRLFTGSIEGCGSGTFALDLTGTATLRPNPSQTTLVDTTEPTQTLIPGSTTTGFAGLVDARVNFQFNLTPQLTIRDGTVKGTAWCRGDGSAPGAKAPHGGHEIAIKDTLVTDGFLLPEYVQCDPTRPGVCETYANLVLQLAGNMQGTLVDSFHFHVNADGSLEVEGWRFFTGAIDDCGSGTIAFYLKGRADRPAPSTTRPGYLHLKEPPMALVPGATSTGFQGVVAAALTLEGDFYGGAIAVGTMTGTVACR